MDRPLLELAEGKDQDQRALLLAAFRRRLGQRNRREMWDLHVRELLTYVLVNDRGGSGVQLTYDEIADKLCCERRTARLVVEREAEHFGLLMVVESRYVRGGQAPNRYAIDWDEVRAANGGASRAKPIKVGLRNVAPTSPARQQPLAGDMRWHPGDATCHPPATTRHAPAATRHPYKEEYPLSSPSLNPHLPLTAATATVEAPASAGSTDGWSEVVVVLDGVGLSDVLGAVSAARARGLSPQEVRDLVDDFERLRARDSSATVGYLHRWLTGRSKPPERASATAKPAADESTLRGDAMTRDEVAKASLRRQIVLSARRAGVSEDEIKRRCEAAGLEYS